MKSTALGPLAFLAALTLVPTAHAEVDQLSRLPVLDGAQPVSSPPRLLTPSAVHRVGQKETFSIIYDDGEPEPGFGPVGGSGDFFDIALLFELPRVPVRVDEVSVCLQRNGTDANFQGELNLFAADGPGGAPGTVLDFFTIEATDVPAGVGGAFYTYDISEFNVELANTDVYIGISWDEGFEQGFFVCADDDRATVQPGFFDTNFDGTWTPLTTVDSNYRTLMIRGTFSDVGGGGTGPCVADATTLCLSDDRFRVQVDFNTVQGQMGDGMAVELTPDTGYFWFFNQENVEMVIKVLDACSFANRFWVFAGGLTNVEVDITVTDTQTGEIQSYSNPQETPFQPIQDTQAFATCP